MELHFYMILILYANFGNGAETSSFSSFGTKNESTIIDCEHGIFLADSVCLPKIYLKGQVPKVPTRVVSRLEISSIREINDKNMIISLEIYQETLWVDDRMKSSLTENEVVVLNNNMISLIWKPDLWIQNLLNFRLHTILEPTGGLIIMNKKFCKNKDLSLMIVRANSESQTKNCAEIEEDNMKQHLLIMYNMEAQVQLYCNFHFENYPMDTQTCDIVMNSAYPYPGIVDLVFEQGQFGVTNNNLNSDDFQIEVIFHETASPNGINILIRLERRILPFIIKYYLPSIAIAIISLVNYCIPIEATPARVTLLVTQFLTLTNILIYQQVRYTISILSWYSFEFLTNNEN